MHDKANGAAWCLIRNIACAATRYRQLTPNSTDSEVLYCVKTGARPHLLHNINKRKVCAQPTFKSRQRHFSNTYDLMSDRHGEVARTTQVPESCPSNSLSEEGIM